MTWKVLWSDEAGTELQRILSASRFAEQIIAEVRQYDRDLSQSPQTMGESREGNRRVFIARSFVLTFRVFVEKQTVLVVRFHSLNKSE